MKLERLSIEELDDLIERASKTRDEAKQEEARRREAIAHVEQTASVYGLTLEDLVGKSSGKTKPSGTPRQKGGAVGNMRRWTEEDDQTLIQMNEDGKSHAEIGEVLGRTAKSVGVHLTIMRKEGRAPKA